MVGFLKYLATILLTWPLSVAAATLDLKIDSTRTELGAPLNVQMIGTGFREKLSDISLQPLRQDFGVQTLEYTSSKQDTGSLENFTQIYSLKLYPRRTGKIIIPSLTFAGATSKQVEIHVTGANTGSAPITLESSISSKSVWSREQILVTISVTTPDLFASLESPRLHIDNFEVIPIQESHKRTSINGKPNAVLQTGWVLFPLASGKETISLPAIRYNLDGVIQRTFYLPLLHLNIKKISPYVPPVLPVGKVTLESEIQAQRPLYTDTLYYWNITLHGDGITPWSLPPVLRQIKSNEDIHFIPANSKRETNTDLTGLHGKVVHRIPFKALNSGSLKLPKLRIQYFDPDNGRIVNITHQPENIFALGMIWRVIAGLVFLLIIYRAVRYILRKWIEYRERYHLRKKALATIEESSNSLELRASLNLVAKSEGWHDNLSLTEWAHCWQRKYKTGNEFTEAISELSALCYSQKETRNIDKLKIRILTIVKNRRKLGISQIKAINLDYWLPENFLVTPLMKKGPE
jgi:hypothetical protein